MFYKLNIMREDFQDCVYFTYANYLVKFSIRMRASSHPDTA